MFDYLKEDNLIFYKFEEETKHSFNIIINPSNNTEEIIQDKPFLFLDNTYKYKNNKVKANYIGFTILEFLNNYEIICNLCEKYIKQLAKSNNKLITSIDADGIIDCEIECQIILENLMEDINNNIEIKNCASFLVNDIYSFSYNFFIQIRKYTDELQNVITKIEQQSNTINYPSERITALKKQLKYLTTSAIFYKKKCIEFMEDYKENLNNLYQLFANTFMPQYQEYKDFKTNKETWGKIKRQNKYQPENIQIPIVDIKLENLNKKKILKYSYVISSLKELGTISLYHIMLIDKTIKKCSYCNNYFIPENNKEVYCNNLQRAIKIQQTLIPTGKENIINIQEIREVMTKDNDIIIKKIYEKNKLTGKSKLLKKEKTNNNQNLIKSNTLKTQFDKKTIKQNGTIVQLIKQSCQDLGKKKTYIKNLTVCDILYIKLKDRIKKRINTAIKSNDLKNLKIFENEKLKLEKLYNDLLAEYNDTNEKFYRKLHIELTKFDYEYIKRHPSEFKPYTSNKFWEEKTKQKLNQIK